MKKIFVLLISLILAVSSSLFLFACGGGEETPTGDGTGDGNGCLTIRYFQGGYGDDWLKASIKDFFKSKGIDNPIEGKDYSLIPDADITANQKSYISSKNNAPDIMMTQGGIDAYIKEGLIADLTGVFESNVSKLDGSTIKVKEFMIPEAYSSVTRPRDYGVKENGNWYIPWTAQTVTLAYNDTLLKATVHTNSGIEIAGLNVGETWKKAPKTVDELIAYFADVKAGNSGKIPFGWSYDVSNWFEFLTTTWWAQIQGTKTSNFDGEKSFYDFYNFNDINLFDQTGMQQAIDVLRSLILDNGNYINSDMEANNIKSLTQSLYLKNAANGRYAVWVAGDFFENESIDKENATFTTKLMSLPRAKYTKGGTTIQTEKDLTLSRVDEAWYIPAKAKNKELAKEFLVFTCNESQLLNFTKACGGLRPFEYNPQELDKDYTWTEFQKSFFDIYNNGERIVEFPLNVKNASEISPVFMYNKDFINIGGGDYLRNIFNQNNNEQNKSSKDIMKGVKTSMENNYRTWRSQYSKYFN